MPAQARRAGGGRATVNYDEERQTKGGHWHWTTMNDGVVRTCPPCIQVAEVPIKDLGRVPVEVLSRCSHATKEEAERHFYDDCLGRVTERGSEHWMDCGVCGAPTKRMLGNMDLSSLFHSEPFCDEHLSEDSLKQLHPFETGIYLMHS